MLSKELITKISDRVGLNVDDIRSYSPEKLRTFLEQRNKRKFSFKSEFPTIGRGNVLRDSLVTSNQLNRCIDAILK